MKSLLCSFIFLLFASLPNVWSAENHFFFLGGGGEPTGEKTRFDENIWTLKPFIKNGQWKTKSLFNGGHAQTEKLFNETYKGVVENEDFVEANYDKLLNDLKNDILSGKIGKDDQILFGIDSHGGKKTSNEVSHQIALARDSGDVSMDKLIEISKLATSKGIRFAIIDNSCFSGNTQALKKENPDLCIVTSSPSTGVAYGNHVIKSVLAQAPKYENLEDSFLGAIDNINAPNYPMISTEANDKIIKEIEKFLGIYTFRDDPNSNRLGAPVVLLRGLMPNEDCISCSIEVIEQNFDRIQKHVANLMKVLESSSPKRKAKLKEFNDSIAKYFLTLQDHLYKYQNYQDSKQSAEAILKIKMPDFLNNYSLYDLTRESDDKMIAALEAEKNKTTDPEQKAEDEKSLQWLKGLHQQKKAALDLLPKEVKDGLFALKETFKSSKIIPLSGDMAKKYRDYYKLSYMEENAGTPTNPCREFILQKKSAEKGDKRK